MFSKKYPEGFFRLKERKKRGGVEHPSNPSSHPSISRAKLFSCIITVLSQIRTHWAVSSNFADCCSTNWAIRSYWFNYYIQQNGILIRKLGLGEISTKQPVDNFLLGSIITKLWVCNQLIYQTNPRDIYLFHLLILYYFFKVLLF